MKIPILLLLAIMIVGCSSSEVSNGLTKNNKFPDSEVCSLACAASWETYTNANLSVDSTGYRPKSGDTIEWKLTKIDSGWSVAYRGVWYASKKSSPLKVHISVNGTEKALNDPECDDEICQISLLKPVDVSSGDIIRLDVKGFIAEDFVVSSLQPTGGH